MKSDLVKRLREQQCRPVPMPGWSTLCGEAADALTRLTSPGEDAEATAEERATYIAKNTAPAFQQTFLFRLLRDLAHQDARVAAQADELTTLRAVVEACRLDKEEAEARIEELKDAAEDVSTEFEKDCWKAMRRILNKLEFDWSGDPVTVDLAETSIVDSIDDMKRERVAALARFEAAEKALAEARRLAAVDDAVFDTFIRRSQP